MAEMIKLLVNWLGIFRLEKADLALENLALGHQLLILERRGTKPRALPVDRLFWVILCRTWGRWKEVLRIFQPKTAVGWSRSLFSCYWSWISRRRGGRPKIDQETIDLIRQMWTENPTWGSLRIRRELLKLGIRVAKSTIQKYRPSETTARDQSWATFLRNHLSSVVAVDFFTVPTVTCSLLYVFVVLHHD